MKANILITIFVALTASVCLYAQDPHTEYMEFIKKQRQEYNDFRKKENEEFVSFLKSYWKPYTKEAPVEAPTQPDPINPTIYTGPLLTPEKSPQVPIVPPLKFNPDDKPVISVQPPKPATPQEDKSHIVLSFYGTPLSLTKLSDTPFRLKGITENNIANAWQELSSTPYQALINDCLRIKKELQLCDWAYFLLTGEIAKHFCGENAKNEITFMQMFLLCQSGYKAKNGRTENALVLLVSMDSIVYGFPFLTIDNDKYYMLSSQTDRMEIYTYKENFTCSTRPVSMHIGQLPVFASDAFTRTLQAKRYPVKATITLNRHLIEFFKDYPQCEYTVYADSPVSHEIARSLLPALSESIQGKTVTEAADILLNFVQTAFEYQTDQQQFGYEKPFFVEETLYYPYCDCEDRSVLYAYLVRNLLKLDVVLLNYPKHLATAVLFGEPAGGDIVTVSGQKYTVCDPTYINAPIGRAMPQYKQTIPKIITIAKYKTSY